MERWTSYPLTFSSHSCFKSPLVLGYTGPWKYGMKKMQSVLSKAGSKCACVSQGAPFASLSEYSAYRVVLPHFKKKACRVMKGFGSHLCGRGSHLTSLSLSCFICIMGMIPSSKGYGEDHLMCLVGCLVDSKVFILRIFPQTTEFKIEWLCDTAFSHKHGSHRLGLLRAPA